MARMMILVLLYALILVLAPSTADGRARIGHDKTVLVTDHCPGVGDLLPAWPDLRVR
jgi:hypothetical protein